MNTVPALLIRTTEGVVGDPSLLGTMKGTPCCNRAIAEFVVPRSIPTLIVLSVIRFLLNFLSLDDYLRNYHANTVYEYRRSEYIRNDHHLVCRIGSIWQV